MSTSANLFLIENVEYAYEDTRFGQWRRFGFTNGHVFEEYRTNAEFLGLPLVHITRGRSPETGRRVTAKGVIAIGRFAMGILAIGQVAFGMIAIGQLAMSAFLGIGQLSVGTLAVGQGAIGILFGLGQGANGFVAIGQFGYGTYVLAQLGLGEHVIDTNGVDPAARQFFDQFLP